jgi:hypothetical protein
VISRGRIIDEIESADLSERRIIEAIVRSKGRERSDGAVAPAVEEHERG